MIEFELGGGVRVPREEEKKIQEGSKGGDGVGAWARVAGSNSRARNLKKRRDQIGFGLLAGFCGSRNRCAFQDRMAAVGSAYVEHGQSEGSAHEDDR